MSKSSRWRRGRLLRTSKHRELVVVVFLLVVHLLRVLLLCRLRKLVVGLRLRTILVVMLCAVLVIVLVIVLVAVLIVVVVVVAAVLG